MGQIYKENIYNETKEKVKSVVRFPIKSGLKTSKFIGKKFQSIFNHLKKSIHFILLINWQLRSLLVPEK
jgi:hypothetical protein